VTGSSRTAEIICKYNTSLRVTCEHTQRTQQSEAQFVLSKYSSRLRSVIAGHGHWVTVVVATHRAVAEKPSNAQHDMNQQWAPCPVQ